MDVKRKIWMRALSVFLATLMVIQILPLNAFAKDVVQKQAIEDTQPKVSDNDEITVKTEIESMRTENSKTFLCVEVVPEQTSGDSITMMTIYVFAYCSKNLMQTYHRKGQAGTRIDILASDIDKLLNGNKEFGIGPLE